MKFTTMDYPRQEVVNLAYTKCEVVSTKKPQTEVARIALPNLAVITEKAVSIRDHFTFCVSQIHHFLSWVIHCSKFRER